ncbi:MAG: MATE family efflux transporter [Clostridia bacterium]|nr:MATE family efflux transporter [Clostridia bacterium]
MLKKFIGDASFYKKVILLALPIMIQNGITNFVNMLDNLMVGQLGQAEMTAVSVSNQLIFVFNLCVFGAVSGAGIFGAQFFGKRDVKGLRDTFRFKLIAVLLICVLALGIFTFFASPLVSLYLKGEGSAETAEASLAFGIEYLHIMLIGLIPAALVQCYASTLREMGQTTPPMTAGIIAVLANLTLNYVLIFGHFGAPKLGVAGAAIATVMSRFIEVAYLILWTRLNKQRCEFIVGAYRSLRIPMSLVKKIIIKGIPLMANETMWATGIAFVSGCYSVKGLDVVAANNIVQSFFNVFSVAFIAVGSSVGIILGQLLGQGKTDEARDSSVKLITFSVLVSVVVAAVFFVCAEFIPDFYNLDDSVKLLATRMMRICAIILPFDAFVHATYFTLRSGGEVTVTLIFDSGFSWCVLAPIAFLLCNYSPWSILPIYSVCQALTLLKCVLGAAFVKRGKWIKRIVE